jgi:predicted extracellular nuclease
MLPALLTSAFPGCALFPGPSSGDNASDSGNTAGGGGGDGAATIYDVRSGEVADGESVTLSGVLVSSPLTREMDGFFIQDPEGGPGSGLYAWKQGGFYEGEFTLQPGDEVRITGQVSEFYGWTELVITDLSSVEKTGTGVLPEPADLGDGAGVEWDDYESVPVTLQDQVVVSVDGYNTGTLSAGIALDDGFVYNDYDCRGAFGTVTGIVFYQYERHSLNNRSAEDLGAYTAPTAIEATIAEVQAGAACGPVTLRGVVTTSPQFGSGNTTIFASDPAGGENSGIAIYTVGGAGPLGRGRSIDVTGNVSEYFGLTEIYVADSSFVADLGPGTEPAPLVIAETPLDWEPYESALVTVVDVTAVSDESYGKVLTDLGASIGDLFYDWDGQSGDHWASVTGPLYYTDYTADGGTIEWTVEPRSAEEMVR